MDDIEIIELATLQLAVDRLPDDQELLQAFENGLTRLRRDDYIGALCMHLAAALMGRQEFELSTPNSETERRCRAIAAVLGATVLEGFEGDLFFKPATVH